jgi:hypothetical protein
MSNLENETPLAQVSATSLNELFNKDPRTLEDAEITTIIAALRKDRERWIVEDKAEKVKKTSPGAKTPKIAAAASLKLDDLDL